MLLQLGLRPSVHQLKRKENKRRIQQQLLYHNSSYCTTAAGKNRKSTPFSTVKGLCFVVSVFNSAELKIHSQPCKQLIRKLWCYLKYLRTNFTGAHPQLAVPNIPPLGEAEFSLGGRIQSWRFTQAQISRALQHAWQNTRWQPELGKHQRDQVSFYKQDSLFYSSLPSSFCSL